MMNAIAYQKLLALPYTLARRTKRYLKRKVKDLVDPNQKVVSLKPPGNCKGNVLLSYFTEFFLLSPGQAPPTNTHSRYWESLLMARIFLDLGYSVDVIHHTNRTFVPKKDYRVLIDVRHNLELLAPLMSKSCLKIAHIDVCHILYQNAAEWRRLWELQQRRGATLIARRFEWPNLAIEVANCATILGNKFTMDTFRYANKPLYPVPIIPSGSYSWPEEKDFETCRNRFLWFGSGGLVRKGLDLVLEAFAAMPDCHLTVCGPVNEEKDFESAYHKELYETSNIETVGWVDIDSGRFREICRNSAAMIYPSCAEGQCGGVITCLHAGLIPVISYESGVDVHNFGMILPNCSIQEIQNAVRHVSHLPAKRLAQMAREAWEYARANHTHQKFAQEYRKVIEHVLGPRPWRNNLA
jgi:glycosyltransferase involved in cell wall biosynthesis